MRRITVCEGCRNRIDPDVCHCGDEMDKHHFGSGHSPVPVGCTCGYHKAVKLVKRSGWSDCVRKRLDPARPKYSNAVKSLAAHAPGVSIFEVWVAHLDDACKEASLMQLFDEEPKRQVHLVRLPLSKLDER